MYYSKEVGLRIKNLRRQRNMTQIELAEKLCYATERQVQRIENGEAMCPTDRLVELAEILKTSTDYLLMGQEEFLRAEEVEKMYQGSSRKMIVIMM